MVGIFGARGSGKTTFALRELDKLKRFVIFDPMADPDLDRIGAKRVTTLAGVKDAMRADWRGFKIVYTAPTGREPLALSRLSYGLIQAQQPYRQSSGRKGSQLTLVVDEMNLSFPVRGGAEKAPGFAEICSRGRHSGIAVYGLSQRIAEVDTRFRGNLARAVILRQQGKNDIRAAAETLGIAETDIRALRDLDYLIGENGRIDRGRLKFSKS